MRFVGFWEFDPEDLDNIVEKSRQTTAEREDFPRSYPEIIFGPCLIGGVQKGFTVYEAEDPEQLANVSLRYMPEMRFRFIPIFETEMILELRGELAGQSHVE